jgi:hypothetical protein
LDLPHFHLAEQSEQVERIPFSIKNRKRLPIQSHQDVGLGRLHVCYSDWRGIDPVAQHDVARPDWNPPKGFPALHVGQLEEVALQIR